MSALPARLYRVLEGPHRGLLVGDDDSCECDECDGDGTTFPNDCEWPCPQCNGVGRVLGYPSVGRPIRLEVAEATSIGARREEVQPGQLRLQARALPSGRIPSVAVRS